MSDSSNSIHRVANLLGYFRKELAIAFEKLSLTVADETEAYLVHMLEGFSKIDAQTAQEVGFHKPAAMLLGEAMNSIGDRRIEAYRRLGDASLFSCGFFDQFLARAPVSPEYYRTVGRTAYHNLGDLMSFKQPGGVFNHIFLELAAKFDAVVDALHVVRQNARQEDLSDPLLERWRRGEQVDLRELMRLGLMPSNDHGEA